MDMCETRPRGLVTVNVLTLLLSLLCFKFHCHLLDYIIKCPKPKIFYPLLNGQNSKVLKLKSVLIGSFFLMYQQYHQIFYCLQYNLEQLSDHYNVLQHLKNSSFVGHLIIYYTLQYKHY